MHYILSPTNEQTPNVEFLWGRPNRRSKANYT